MCGRCSARGNRHLVRGKRTLPPDRKQWSGAGAAGPVYSVINNPSGNATISKITIPASTRSARLHFFQSATKSRIARHVAFGSARNCVREGRASATIVDIRACAVGEVRPASHILEFMILLRAEQQSPVSERSAASRSVSRVGSRYAGYRFPAEVVDLGDGPRGILTRLKQRF
jgi:hypothetical protein